MKECLECMASFYECFEREIDDGNLNFPSVFELSMRIKRIADDPNSTLIDLSNAIRGEPVLSARILRMANTMQMNPYHVPITSISDAISRLGLNVIRVLAYSVAAEQLVKDYRSSNLQRIARHLWHHSMDVACWSHALSKELKISKPDTAMLTGMMRSIGQFYLLAKVAEHPSVIQDIHQFSEFAIKWRFQVGHVVRQALDLPQSIQEALSRPDHQIDRWPLARLEDIIYVSIWQAETANPFEAIVAKDQESEIRPLMAEPEDQLRLLDLFDRVSQDKHDIFSAVCGEHG